MRRVLVTGSRDWVPPSLVEERLDLELEAHGEIMVIHGGCRSGADLFAQAWADRNEMPTMKFPARWKRVGRKAGPLRNQKMIDVSKPDVVYGFVRPESVGTRDCISRAELAGIPVYLTWFIRPKAV